MHRHRRTTAIAGTAAVLITALAVACSRDEGGSEPRDGGARSSQDSPAARDASGRAPVTTSRGDDPPYAQRFRVDELRADRDAPRSEADGAGRAWIDGDRVVRAGARGRWTIHYEAGPLGVALGGSVRVTIPPFWNWTAGQTHSPDAPGYVTARVASPDTGDLELEVSVAQGFAIGVFPTGRALREGERLEITYGAGPARAQADRYAERESPFWVTVDGDGDGVGGLVVDSPTIEIVAGRPRRLVLTLPSTAHPGDEVLVRFAVLDRFGNAGVDFTGEVQLIAVSDGLELPESVRLEADARGVGSAVGLVTAAGVHHVVALAVPDEPPADAAEDFEGWGAESNPLEANARAPRILWADLHGHSNLSDGTGTPEDFLVYARDVAALDVVSLTDHDHWGMRKLDATPEMWERIRAATNAANAPGEFVSLLGYEWTSWIHGHRHVVYFGDEGGVISSVDEETESPTGLWDALRAQGQPALTFAHHSAGGPIPTNWDVAPDPEFEPVTEVASVHGVSEGPDSPLRIYQPKPNNYVRDALDRGYKLGFVGSGDGHDGHPGLPQMNAACGGLAAILSEDRTREGVLAALRERRCYATNGPRIILRAALGEARMGSTLKAPAAGADPLLLFVHAIGTAPLERIEVIRAGAVRQVVDCEGAWDLSTAFDVADLAAGEYVYVRVVQQGDGLAWSSPFFIE